MSLAALLLLQMVHSFNLDMDIYGHRGGFLQLIPEHTIASFSLGAQEGADYLEPDLVMSKDGHLIVSHDLELSISTDVDRHLEFSDRYQTLSIWDRGNPQNITHGQPDTMKNGHSNQTGWFIHEFTLSELKTLRKLSTEYRDDSPFNGIWRIMTFNESLELIQNLSRTLNRSIGVIPETKNPEWLKFNGFDDIEHKVLESLRAYGFVYIDEDDGYYKPNYFKDDADMKPLVVLQSFTPESLFRFEPYSKDFIPRMMLMAYADFDDDKDSVDRSVIEWILSFAEIIGCSKHRVEHLLNARLEFDDLEFGISAYTLLEDLDEYITFIAEGLDGIFTDDVGTARNVKQMLNKLIDGERGVSEFCNVSSVSNDDGKIEVKYALIGAFIVLIIGLGLGALTFFMRTRYKLEQFAKHERLCDE